MCSHQLKPIVKAGEVKALRCTVCQKVFSRGSRTFSENINRFESPRMEYSGREKRLLVRLREQKEHPRNYQAATTDFDFDEGGKDRPYVVKFARGEGLSASYYRDVLSGDSEIVISETGRKS